MSYTNKVRSAILAVVFIMLLHAPAFAQKRNINLVFIGNSITQGVQLNDPGAAPPAMAAAYLRQYKNTGHLKFSNQGHSGFTTVDFLPATGNTFKKVEDAASAFADRDALLIFSIMLGTNDSAIQGPNGSPVAPDDYAHNLKTIVDKLLADFPKAIIIFQHPLWYSPNTYNGAQYLQEGLTRLQSYIPKLDELVAAYAATNPGQVFTGDKKGFAYFKKNHLTDQIPENGHQGTFYLHPNKKGADMLGKFWAKAIERCVRKIK